MSSRLWLEPGMKGPVLAKVGLWSIPEMEALARFTGFAKIASIDVAFVIGGSRCQYRSTIDPLAPGEF
jgi:hypothetical protein